MTSAEAGPQQRVEGRSAESFCSSSTRTPAQAQFEEDAKRPPPRPVRDDVSKKTDREQNARSNRPKTYTFGLAATISAAGRTHRPAMRSVRHPRSSTKWCGRLNRRLRNTVGNLANILLSARISNVTHCFIRHVVSWREICTASPAAPCRARNLFEVRHKRRSMERETIPATFTSKAIEEAKQTTAGSLPMARLLLGCALALILFFYLRH